MAKTFNGNKLQILTKIVIPANISTFINSLKVNIGLSLVGVISGEFLVSKAGLRLFNSIWRSSVSARFSNGKCSNTCSYRSNYVWGSSPTRKNNFKNKKIWINWLVPMGTGNFGTKSKFERIEKQNKLCLCQNSPSPLAQINWKEKDFEKIYYRYTYNLISRWWDFSIFYA